MTHFPNEVSWWLKDDQKNKLGTPTTIKATTRFLPLATCHCCTAAAATFLTPKIFLVLRL
jgi:hypothetical protein